MKIFYILLILLLNNPIQANIHEHGYWIGTNIVCEHKFDRQLGNAICDFLKFEKTQSIVDFGCGLGDYTKLMLKNNFDCEGYDGNPNSPELTEGLVQVLDLSQPFDLEKCYDWVVCLEVGEHLPKQYEQTLIDNLHRHNTQGIILSWAIKGQDGYGHFNTQDNWYIKAIFKDLGYENDLEVENYLRKLAFLPWFKNTVMVFRKNITSSTFDSN